VYATHPGITEPTNLDQKIWRYFDFAKFMSMLENRALFFVEAGALPDTWEGAVPPSVYNRLRSAYGPINDDGTDPIRQSAKEQRELVILNCWHANDGESAAMWDLYSSHGLGIAIQSTVRRLQRSLKNCPRDVYVGCINYIDHANDDPPVCNTFELFMYKRKSFEHEREIRAVISRSNDRYGWPPKPPLENRGLLVSISLGGLIENVYISPTAGKWAQPLVASIMRKYRVNRIPIQSDLYRDPLE
jgi:hypothetical protein